MMPCPIHPTPLYRPGEPFDPQVDCRVCWLAANGGAPRQAPGGAVHATGYPCAGTMVATAAVAMARWIAAGRPTRSPEECARIHAICEACPSFDAAQDRCRECGCGLSRDSAVAWVGSLGIPDGIKMATHRCPLTKW